MALGLSGGLLGTCLLAACGDHSGTVALAVFGAITGCVGLCMPAMTGVALAGLRPQRPGAAGPDLPHLRLPMILAATGYLIAVIVTLTAIGGATRRPR